MGFHISRLDMNNSVSVSVPVCCGEAGAQFVDSSVSSSIYIAILRYGHNLWVV